MRINQFFAEILGAPLHNRRQSWGAYKKEANRVFLRIGKWSIDDYTDGKRWAIIMEPSWSESYGGKERVQQLNLIRSGAEAFAVVVDWNSAGKISWFDDKDILRIGKIVEEHGTTYAEILGSVDIEQFFDSDSDLIESDIAEINSQDIPATVRQALINARKGQGKFRKDLLKLWGYQCAVTGSTTKDAIRASHIKPWQGSSNEERLNPRNGLPLLATLDALFDKGLITFNSDGKMLVSSTVSKKERELLGLTGLRLTAKPHSKTCDFLSSHFENRFQR